MPSRPPARLLATSATRCRVVAEAAIVSRFVFDLSVTQLEVVDFHCLGEVRSRCSPRLTNLARPAKHTEGYYVLRPPVCMDGESSSLLGMEYMG